MLFYKTFSLNVFNLFPISERLDNFILDIIRLKEDIKRQLAEEEALEAKGEGSKSQVVENQENDYRAPPTSAPELQYAEE